MSDDDCFRVDFPEVPFCKACRTRTRLTRTRSHHKDGELVSRKVTYRCPSCGLVAIDDLVKRDPAQAALDAIARACGCEEWDYPGQVVRDVEALKAELVAARKSGRAWKRLAKEQAGKLRRTPTRGELRHIGWLRQQRDNARATVFYAVKDDREAIRQEVLDLCVFGNPEAGKFRDLVLKVIHAREQS